MDSSVLTSTLGCNKDHADVWKVQIKDEQPVCLACTVEVLEEHELPIIRKKPIIDNLGLLLTSHSKELSEVLSIDQRVPIHLAATLLDLMLGQDEPFVLKTIDVNVKLLCLLNNEDIVNILIDIISEQLLQDCNYRKNLPHINFVGQLMDKIPGLTGHLLENHVALLECVCAGLDHPDHSVQASVSFLAIHMYAPECRGLVTPRMDQQLVQSCLKSLSTAPATDLLVNLLGLVKVMLEDARLVEFYMSPAPQSGIHAAGRPRDMPGFPIVVKKLLLHRDEAIQIAAVQCVAMVLQHPSSASTYTDIFLQADIAEFLFENLVTLNNLLLGSLYCTLTLFTESATFFIKCHAVYGVEAVLRSLDQLLPSGDAALTEQGLGLLARILHRHDGGVRLFSTPGLVCMCCRLLVPALSSPHGQIRLAAENALIHLTRKAHMPLPVPFDALLEPIQASVEQCAEELTAPPPKLSRVKHAGKPQQIDAIQTLHRLLTIIENATRLAVDCEGQPEADAQTYHAPDTPHTPSSLAHYVTCLVGVTQRLVLPTATHLVEEHQTTARSVLLHTLQVALLVLRAAPITKRCEFVCSILTARLLRAALAAKPHISADDQEVVTRLLCAVIEDGLEADQEGSAPTDHVTVFSAAHSITGPDKGIEELVVGGDGANGTSEIGAQRQVIIGLVYLTAKYDDSLLSPPRLLSCVDALLCAVGSGSNTENVPRPVLRHIIYLYAVSYTKCDADDLPTQTKGLQTLLELVQAQHSATWCGGNETLLLRWCFTDDRITLVCGPTLVSHCAERLADHVTWQEDLSQHAATSTTGCKVLVDALLLTKQPKLVCEVLETAVFNPNAVLQVPGEEVSCREEVRGVLASYLPHTALRVLRQHDSPVPAENLQCVFRALGGLLQLVMRDEGAALEPLTSTELRLLHHCGKLFENNTSDETLHDSVLTFLTQVLVYAGRAKDDRVLPLVVACGELMQHVQSRLLRVHVTALCFTTALLAQTPGTSDTHAPGLPVLEVPKAEVLSLTAPRPAALLARLLFWAVYLLPVTSDRAPLVRLVRGQRQQEQLCDDEELQDDLSDAQVRVMVLYLQQLLLQGETPVREAASVCYWRLMHHLADNRDTLCSHVGGQPWNRLLLQIVAPDRGTALPPWLLRLTLMFCEHAPGTLNAPLLESVQALYLAAEDNNPTYALLRDICLQIQHRNLIDLEQATKDKLKKSETLALHNDHTDISHLLQTCVDLIR